MATPDGAGGTGHARYTYRLRVSTTALAGLDAEWARCRWVWNECVAMSQKVHGLNGNAAEKVTCGPALDKLPTDARDAMGWLRQGSSVPQQQMIRDLARSRAKALEDLKAKLPMRQRAGMPRIKRKRAALPSMNYTRRGFRLKDGRLCLAGNIALTVVWFRDLPADPTSGRVYRDSLGHWYASFVVEISTDPLPATGRATGIDWGVKETAATTSAAHDLAHPKDFRPRFPAGSTMARKAADAATSATKNALLEMARKHGRTVHLVNPAHTTMDCARCGARTKHALPLSERTYTCTACGAVSPRDKNSARVVIVRAGLDPASADLVSPATC
ncbi:RNA-guided endonuclease InsQ/TnpB family protein [Streptomyces sp. NPDC060002]|uniref:RNA-guided endonuclease InsQ/TnpB family protein n=1 Tax=Streptomyces sp. NPDC060002 TaxID=3347033 RepID=UPI0036CC01F7